MFYVTGKLVGDSIPFAFDKRKLNYSFIKDLYDKINKCVDDFGLMSFRIYFKMID